MRRHYKNFELISLYKLSNKEVLKRLDNKGELFVYCFKEKALVCEFLENKKIVKYLDRFILILPNDYEEQSRFWLNFYKEYGSIYEEIIDIKNNISCIKLLHKQIKEEINILKNTIILDYGCGSGLFKFSEMRNKIIGYEPIEKMREQAQLNGLKILGRDELNNLPNSYFDAVYASYVFHMGIQRKDIIELTKKTKKNAIIVANFYKNINVDNVNDIFLELNYTIKKVENIDKRFGRVYKYRQNLFEK